MRLRSYRTPVRDVLPYFVDRGSISTIAPLMKADLKISNTQLASRLGVAIPYAFFQRSAMDRRSLGSRLTLALCCAIVGSRPC